MNMEDRRNTLYSKEIIRKIIIILIGLTFVSIILITGIVLYRYHIFSNKIVNAHFEELVRGHKLHIDFFLKEKLRNINYLSRNFGLESFEDDSFLQERLHDLQEDYNLDFVDLELIDQNGHQVAYAGPSGLKDIFNGNTGWFKQTMKTGHYISDVIKGPKTQPQLMVATKVQNEDSQWILKATIDLGYLNSLLQNLKIGETGAAFILNRKGEFQIRPPDKIKVTPQQYLSLFDNKNQAGDFNEYDNKPLVSHSKSIISVEEPTRLNQKLFIASAFLKNNEWVLIFQQDTDEAFAGLDFSRKFINLIFLWGCLAVILACVLLFRRSHKQTSMVNSGKELMMAEQFIKTDKLDSIGELASGIAHEINNPVAIMVEEAGWVQDLIHEGIDKNDNLEEFIRALKQIETQGRRCKEITRKLLSFGRKTDFRIEKIQLNELIEEVVSLSSEKARHANIKIHTKLDPTLPEIHASVTEMQQVLANIINNGLDAMETKGDRMDISSRLHEDHIIITFRDNGPGIHAINLNRVFDPFFSTKPVGKGSGLGLSICYGIIKKMGGRIDFESVLGEGSAFHIVLPTGLFKQ
jgi:two-component system, NtrC family, sensor kinase